MRFMIKPLAGSPIKEGDSYIRFTGSVEPFIRGDEMRCEVIGTESDGKGKLLKFTTGLDEDQVDFLPWFSEDGKNEYKKLLKEYKPIISKKFGGDKVIDSTNKYFWQKSERNRIKVTNETENKIFDMAKAEHAMLYFNIIGGAFTEIIAPSKEMAEVESIPHYLVLENDVEDDIAEDYATKGEAFSLLTELNKTDHESLLFLAWCLQYGTKSFAGYTRSSSKQELFKYHGEYIEGKLSYKQKRNCPREFVAYASKWKEAGLVKEKVMVEAYLKAAEFYSYLNTNREKRYELNSGIDLGANMEEAVDNITKPKLRKELDNLRNFVEKKWKE